MHDCILCRIESHGQSPGARTIGRLMIQPEIQQAIRTRIMRCLQERKRGHPPLTRGRCPRSGMRFQAMTSNEASPRFTRSGSIGLRRWQAGTWYGRQSVLASCTGSGVTVGAGFWRSQSWTGYAATRRKERIRCNPANRARTRMTRSINKPPEVGWGSAPARGDGPPGGEKKSRSAQNSSIAATSSNAGAVARSDGALLARRWT